MLPAQTACTALEGNISRDLDMAEREEGGEEAMGVTGGRGGTAGRSHQPLYNPLMTPVAEKVVDLDAAVAFSG